MSLIKAVTDKFRGGIPGGSLINEDMVRSALSKVIDPDLHKDIVSLGFVKNIKIAGGKVSVSVELTTPACPVKELLKEQCTKAIQELPGVTAVDVNMTAVTRGQNQQAVAAGALSGVKNIIAVASGKGGVGKSTSAVNLAYALAAQGSKVGILDADVYGPSVPLMTKVANPTEMTANNEVIPPIVDGIKVISVAMFSSAGKASILRGPMAAQIIKQFMTQIAWGELDYLVIDYPPGTGDIQLTLSQLAPLTGAVIVTTPQEVSLIDVRKAISMFETMKVPVLGVVETMSYFLCDGCDKRHEIFRAGGGKRVADEFGLPILGEIPIESIVAVDADEGNPVVKAHPDSAAAKSYVAAAGATAAQLSILHAQDQGALAQFSLTWQ